MICRNHVCLDCRIAVSRKMFHSAVCPQCHQPMRILHLPVPKKRDIKAWEALKAQTPPLHRDTGRSILRPRRHYHDASTFYFSKPGWPRRHGWRRVKGSKRLRERQGAAPD